MGMFIDSCSGEIGPKRAVRRPHARVRCVFFTDGESRTSQAFADQCDINSIMRRFERTGHIPVTRPGVDGVYADVTGLQGDLTTLAHESGVIVSKVTKAAADLQAKAAKEAAERSEADAKELAAFRAAQAAATPPATS